MKIKPTQMINYRAGRRIFPEWLDQQDTTMRWLWFKFLEFQIYDVHQCSMQELPADAYAQEFVDQAFETFQQIALDETYNPELSNPFQLDAELN